MRVIGYTRVSTEEQSRSALSLESQETKIRAYCPIYDLDLVRIVSDPGCSGKDLDRPGMAEVLAALRRRKGGIDGVVIVKLDRLTRSIGDWDDLIREFFQPRAGKRLFSVGDSIDTGTAAGELVLNVLMAVAQWERKAIAEPHIRRPASQDPPRGAVRPDPLRLRSGRRRQDTHPQRERAGGDPTAERLACPGQDLPGPGQDGRSDGHRHQGRGDLATRHHPPDPDPAGGLTSVHLGRPGVPSRNRDFWSQKSTTRRKVHGG